MTTQSREVVGLSWYMVARFHASAASNTCRPPATTLRMPMSRLNCVPRKVAREARGRKEGRHVVGHKYELNVR